MAILFDFNQTVLGGVHAIQKHVPEITTDVVRYVTLNTIRSYLNKYGKKYGKGDRVIICCDSGNGWRRDVFPYYKARRKQGRDKSNIDFKTVFEAMNTIREELEEFFPYRVIKVDRCEGDDIIAVLTRHISENESSMNGLVEEAEPVMIISSDHDFKQLQIFQNVDQFSPLVKKAVRENRPDLYLKEHIIRGDGGDDVPNFMSDDDTFMIEGKRQKPLRTEKVDKWVECDDPRDFCQNDDQLRNYYRNRTMVDLLHCIPEDITESILHAYHEAPQQRRKGVNLLSYFTSRRLKNLLENIQEF